jgi:SAM-dependent methyltransferase
MTPEHDHRVAYYRSYVSGFRSKDAVGGRWDEAAYLRWCEVHYAGWLADARRDGRVLELGAGDGNMLGYLRSAGFGDVSGVDISEQQAQAARRLGRPVVVQDAFDALTVPAGTLSGIVALDFLEHFTKGEVGDLLARAALALEPGGFMLIRTPNGEGLFAGQIIHGDITHATIFTPASLQQALDLAGFGDVRFQEATFVRSGLRGRLRGLVWDAIRLGCNAIRRVQAGKTQQIWSENLLCFARKRAGSSS